jgi:hypothetical protein
MAVTKFVIIKLLLYTSVLFIGLFLFQVLLKKDDYTVQK